MKRERSCGAVVMRQTEKGIKILLIQHWSGNWSFPKGHMEKGENERQTAIREIKEETGLDVVLDEKFKRTITYMPAKNTLKSVVFFVGHSQTGDPTPQPEEVKTLEWVELEKARDRITHDKDKSIMTAAYSYIRRKYMRNAHASAKNDEKTKERKKQAFKDSAGTQ